MLIALKASVSTSKSEPHERAKKSEFICQDNTLQDEWLTSLDFTTHEEKTECTYRMNMLLLGAGHAKLATRFGISACGRFRW